MELKYLIIQSEINRFLGLSREVYRGNRYYRDSMSDIVKLFVLTKTACLKHMQCLPFIIEDEGDTLLRAAFVTDEKLKGILMISFLECRENAGPAVGMMLSQAKQLAINLGLNQIIIGLEAHLNYGVGFLASHFENVPCFGFGYTPEYYLDYFTELQEYRFTSFLVDVSKFNLDKEQSILRRIRRQGITCRFADFDQLEREIKIFTSLSNLAYRNHLWWAERTCQEDWELLHPFRWLLKGENFIIAEKNGEPVGFMLWYPDFNQLIPPGKSIGFSTLLKYKLGGGRGIDRFKIASIAIKPEYQGLGTVLSLFEALSGCVKDRYRWGEAGWIEEHNLKSISLGARWHDLGVSEYKRYKAFEVTL